MRFFLIKVDPVLQIILMLTIVGFLASCGKVWVTNPPGKAYYLYKNNIDVKGGIFSRPERVSLEQRLFSQLDDSARIKTKKKWIFFTVLDRPLAFDSSIMHASSQNINASLFHLGYYNSTIKAVTDTSGKKITVDYLVSAGKPTLIESISYNLKKPDLQQQINAYSEYSFLVKGDPITKAGVITETARIVDSFRNNGYYKFTAAELKVMGDTTNEALTALSDDPFEQLRLLAEAQKRKDSPTIRIAIVLNPPKDSTKLTQYRINNIIVYPDFRQSFRQTDSVSSVFLEEKFENMLIRYHEPMYKSVLLYNNIPFKKGNLFKQSDYLQAIYNMSRLGVWQSINVMVNESADSDSLVDLHIQLTPSKKFGFETALEISYSAASNTSNILAGNLFGLSGNLSLINRNLAKEAIRMAHNIRAGVEFNSNQGSQSRLINSNVISYTNTTSFPKLIFPGIPNAFNKRNNRNAGETFINLGISYNTRLNLFNLQTINAGFGWSGINRRNWKWAWSSLNFGFSNLFNQSDSFRTIVRENPFLNYSYNTAFVNGMGISFSKTRTNFAHPNSLSKELSMRCNAEESGLTWGLLPVFNKYKRKYIKSDFEIKHTIKYQKATLALRGFAGIGLPLLGSDTNRTLPFFKQYFGGGSNSMRAWPVRGIGPGGKPLVPFSSNKTIFNDRTGDMQLELNAEYRFDVATIIPNTLILRGALFTDIGNIWNLRSTKTDNSPDTAQFKLSNLYKQLGVAAGSGLRLDFNYFVLRLDFGFRFKRPEQYYINDGWKAPGIGFDDFLKKIFTKGPDDVYRKWRYENFNFTIGIGYSF